MQNNIDQAGIIKNSIISRDQSHATSRLYAILASRAQGSSRRDGGVIPGRPSGNAPTFPHAPNLIQTAPLCHQPSIIHGSFPPPELDNFGRGYSQQVDSNLSQLNRECIPHFIGDQRGIVVPHQPGVYVQQEPKHALVPVEPRSDIQRPFVPSSISPPPIPWRVGTARGKTVEEAKKVRDYGFPPLPSSRPGLQPPAERTPND